MSSYDMGTAIHEAAHAVVGVHKGFRVYEVYIYPDKSGQTSFGRVNYRDAASVRLYAAAIMAGPIAELMHQGKPTTAVNAFYLEGASADMAKFKALGEQFDLSGVFDETITLVKTYYEAITKVAEQLMRDGSIEGDALGGMI